MQDEFIAYLPSSYLQQSGFKNDGVNRFPIYRQKNTIFEIHDKTKQRSNFENQCMLTGKEYIQSSQQKNEKNKYQARTDFVSYGLRFF